MLPLVASQVPSMHTSSLSTITLPHHLSSSCPILPDPDGQSGDISKEEYNQHILPRMFSSLQRYVPLLEAYLLAKDPRDFQATLSDPTEASLIAILREDVTDSRALQARMTKLGISPGLQEALLELKLVKHLKETDQIKEDEIGVELKRRFSRFPFEFPRPTLTTHDLTIEKEDTTPTCLTLETSLGQYLVHKLQSKPEFVRVLNDYALSKIPEKDILALPLTLREYLVEQCGILSHFRPQFLAKLLIHFEDDKKKQTASYFLARPVLSRLTREQIDYLGKTKPEMFANEDYVELWFGLHYSQRIGKFGERSEYFSKGEHDCKRTEFLDIIQELAQQTHHILANYASTLREEVFCLDILLNDPSLGRLVEHLKTSNHMLQLGGNLRPEFAAEAQARLSEGGRRGAPRIQCGLSINSLGQRQAVEDYILKLFRKSKDNRESILKLGQFLRESYLRRLNVEALLSQGVIPENLNEYYSSEALQQLKDRRQINLHATNKKNFRVGDQVELEASLKNIKKVQIKVYELSLEKQNLANQGSIPDDVNLSFLKPTFEEVYEHKIVNPYAVETVSIPVGIESRMGVFIVDLQGETVTSRAVIRKGAILCLEDFTESGQRFSFHDEDGRPLTEAIGLRVWLNGRPVAMKGRHFFDTDYQEQPDLARIVVSVGSFSQAFEKRLVREDYQFQVGYLFNSESFIVGKKARLVLQGRLAMNGSPMSLQLLKDIKIRVNTTDSQSIGTFYQFPVTEWGDSQDPTVEFPVPSYLQNISVSVTAKIELQSKKWANLGSVKDIPISLGEEQTCIQDIYLEKDEQANYVLSLLGMNGETVPNVNVILRYVVRGVREEESVSVKTDRHGRISLGPLSIVDRLNAHINNSNASHERCWQIDKTGECFNYSSTIWAQVGQTVTLPVDSAWTGDDLVLLRTYGNYQAEDLSKQLGLLNGTVTLPVFSSEGCYLLKLLPLDRDIRITVVRVQKWEGDSEQSQKIYNKEERKVVETTKNAYQGISIRGIKVSGDQPARKVQVELGLEGLSAEKLAKVRVHVFATNYINPESTGLFQPAYFNVETASRETRLASRDSSYYSNRALSDEGAYVWNRQQKGQKLVGNNLEKPGVLLKRALAGETNQEDEHLFAGEEYGLDGAVQKGHAQMSRARHQSAQMRKRMAVCSVLPLTSHNNFLLLSGFLNSSPSGSSLEVEVPSNYSQIEVYVLTPSTAIKRQFSLGQALGRKLKDLRHAGIAETAEDKGWTMSREVYPLGAGEQRTVGRNSQWRTVGLRDIFEFANAKRCPLYSWSADLLNWSSYPFEKKKQVYDKESCHELNAFIRFKDQSFFEKVVAKHIASKINKTFVDYCLLGDAKALMEHASLDRLARLNAFEQVLLVQALASRKESLEEAEAVVSMLESRESSQKRNYEQFKNNFDTIINAMKPEEPKAKKANPEKQKHSRTFNDSFGVGVGGGGGEVAPNPNVNLMAAPVQTRMAGIEKKKKAFVPVESIKEYTQRTYYHVTDYRKEAPTLVASSPFWAELARFFLSSSSAGFLSREFMNFSKGIEFMLAACFVASDSSANFDLSDAGDNNRVSAKSPLLLYVKEVKELDFANKFGVQMSQRFLDLQNRHVVVDGLQVDREVEEFVVKRPYLSQTVVTNTSGTPLELQILLDIPRGTIPLCSHEYTQIVSLTIAPFTSKEFKRTFYAPEEGQFPIYPSNASRGANIIAKCSPRPAIVVRQFPTVNKLESFADILRSGDRAAILKFMQAKNVFDSSAFNPQLILWMLKDKPFYHQVVACLRQRKHFVPAIWNFGFYHWDLAAVRELVLMQDQAEALAPVVFEYFPYYSTRTHQFANESKSTIRNVQFKDSYTQFLVSSIAGTHSPSSLAVSLAYYLILQDRLREAQQVLQQILAKYPREHQVQTDYMRCFLDMSLSSHNFSEAREIVGRYKNYPVESWAKLFGEVRRTLQGEDEELVEGGSERREEFSTQIVQQIGQFRIIQPAGTAVHVQFFQVDLELYFSEFPFSESGTFTSIRPSRVLVHEATEHTKELLIKRSHYPDTRDLTVEVSEIRNGLAPNKVETFAWPNPDVQVKINENQGTLQVFLSSQKLPGAYVKVFSKKTGQDAFYRDGYTDMTGTFRYAMSDLGGISQFSILVLTERGGTTLRVKPPSKLASY